MLIYSKFLMEIYDRHRQSSKRPPNLVHKSVSITMYQVCNMIHQDWPIFFFSLVLNNSSRAHKILNQILDVLSLNVLRVVGGYCHCKHLFLETMLDCNSDYNQMVVLWPVSRLGLHNCLQPNSCSLKMFQIGVQQLKMQILLSFILMTIMKFS